MNNISDICGDHITSHPSLQNQPEPKYRHSGLKQFHYLYHLLYMCASDSAGWERTRRWFETPEEALYKLSQHAALFCM